MDCKSFSKRELVEILEVIQYSLACATETDIRKLFERVRELVCGDYTMGGLGVCINQGLSTVQHTLNVNYPTEWLTIYKKRNLFAQDPIILQQAKVPGSQLWVDTYKMFKDKIPPSFISDAASFNLRYGLSGGMRSPSSRATSIVNFASGKNNFKKHHKAILDILLPHFHEALVRMYIKEERKQTCSLTGREKEILHWVMEGKTNWEISVILKISENTVKFHIHNIEMKLNAVNKTHAVTVALEQGVLD